MAIQEIQENDLIKDSREVINDNFTELDEGKLSLSGGTLTGPLFMTGANDRIVGFEVKDDGTNFDCGWNHANRDGAGFALRSVDFTGNNNTDQGAFHFWARNATASPELVGKPDGTLTWGGSNVITAAGGTMTGNIKFSSGYISRSTDTAALNLSGGSDNESGAYLNLYGKSHASSAGAFSLTSYNGTTRKQLIGKLDGTLTWDGNNVITAAGGTMTGQLVINRSNGSTSGIKLTGIAQNYVISALNTNVTKGTAPSAAQYWAVDFYGKDDASYNQRIGMLETSLNTNNVATTSIRAYNCTTNTNTGNCAITVNVDGSGNAYTSAPTPATTDNSTKIATTAYVKSNLNSYLPLSGGTMTGTITRNGYLAKNSADNGYVEVLGGTDETSSYICIYGKNHSSNPGTINIRAHDGTNSKYLKLTPTAITWNGLDIAPQTETMSGTSSDVSVPSGSTKNLMSFSLTKGTWLVQAVVGFASNATGYRRIMISTSSTASNMDRYSNMIVPAASGTQTHLSLTTIIEVSSTTTYYLNAYQNSGSALNTSAGVKRFRLSADV